MYDRSLFLKLNNYGYSDESIIEVKDYLLNLKMPDKVDTNVKYNPVPVIPHASPK